MYVHTLTMSVHTRMCMYVTYVLSYLHMMQCAERCLCLHVCVCMCVSIYMFVRTLAMSVHAVSRETRALARVSSFISPCMYVCVCMYVYIYIYIYIDT